MASQAQPESDFRQIFSQLQGLTLDDDDDIATIRDLLQQLQQTVPARKDPYAKKTIAATSVSVEMATEMLGIKYNPRKAEFFFDLKGKSESQASITAIDKIGSSQHHQRFRGEPLSRTTIDILLCDRLLALDDRNANKYLQVATEVDIRAELVDDKRKHMYKAGYVTGRADYTLGHGSLKASLEDILIVVEAKKDGDCANAIPQTLCYLAGVQNARKQAGKVNTTVFGIMADTLDYRFVLLDHQRTAFVSRPLSWLMERDRIVAYVDHIFQSAIESSPHTTPVKFNNRQIRQSDARLRETFVTGFGEGSTDIDKRAELGGGHKHEHRVEGYDVVEEDGMSVLVPSRAAEQMEE
ncbi:MAG: hypothetical protein M1840_007786 [Geoglossum simile]|nr:MAG: hypothetical protein M1840_007786 [Geoglossum simile]